MTRMDRGYTKKGNSIFIWDEGKVVASCESDDENVLCGMLAQAILRLRLTDDKQHAWTIAGNVVRGGHSSTSRTGDFQSSDGSASLPARSNKKDDDLTDEDMDLLMRSMFK